MADTSATHSVPAGGYMIQLDGLRAFAVLGVLVQHTLIGANSVVDFGAAGVRLFFVLSGFLITGILLRARDLAEHEGGGTVAVLRAFYARRFLRIFPLYYAVLLISALIGVHGVRASLGWHLAYLSNVFYAAQGSFNKIGPPLGHLWTLSVEEQFYLFWPALLLFLPRHRLPALLAGMVILGPACRFIGTWIAPETPAPVVLTPCCFDSLGLGAVLAYLHCRNGGAPAALGWSRLGLVVGVGLCLAVKALSMADLYEPLRAAAKDLGFSLISVWLVQSAATGFGGVLKKVFEFRPLVYLGSISYGVYLLHEFVGPVVRLIEREADVSLGLPRQAGIVKFTYVGVVTLVAAAASWHFFEKPINELKSRFPYSSKRRAAARQGARAAGYARTS